MNRPTQNLRAALVFTLCVFAISMNGLAQDDHDHGDRLDPDPTPDYQPPAEYRPSSSSYSVSKDFRFTWNYNDETFTIEFKEPSYRACQELYGRSDHTPGNWSRFVTADPCLEHARFVANQLKEIARRKAYSSKRTAELVLNFVASFPYMTDKESTGSDSYARFGSEVILDRRGDCKSHAILFTSLMTLLCFDVVILSVPQHLAVGVCPNGWGEECYGNYYTHNARPYFYCEATGGAGGNLSVGDTPTLKNEKPNQYSVDDFTDVPYLCGG